MTEIQYCPGCDEPMRNPEACGLCGWKSLDEIGKARSGCDRPMCKRSCRVQFVDSDGRARALCWHHYEERRQKEPREAALDQIAAENPEWHRKPTESGQEYRERMREIHAPMFRAIRERMLTSVAQEVQQERIEQGPADEQWFRDNGHKVYG